MADSFSLPFQGKAEELIVKAKNGVEKAGGKFAGTAAKGSFEVPVFVGKVSGSYNIADQKFNVNILDKPFGISGDMIKDQVKKFLS